MAQRGAGWGGYGQGHDAYAGDYAQGYGEHGGYDQGGYGGYDAGAHGGGAAYDTAQPAYDDGYSYDYAQHHRQHPQHQPQPSQEMQWMESADPFEHPANQQYRAGSAYAGALGDYYDNDGYGVVDDGGGGGEWAGGEVTRARAPPPSGAAAASGDLGGDVTREGGEARAAGHGAARRGGRGGAAPSRVLGEHTRRARAPKVEMSLELPKTDEEIRQELERERRERNHGAIAVVMFLAGFMLPPFIWIIVVCQYRNSRNKLAQVAFFLSILCALATCIIFIVLLVDSVDIGSR